MTVQVQSRVPRDGGMVDVTLSQGARRFTVSVTQALDSSDVAMPVYQRMADNLEKEAQALLAIVDSYRSV